MYKGDELLHIGTIEEIAKAHGVTKRTIQFYTSPAYKRRAAKNPDKYITMTRLDDDDE